MNINNDKKVHSKSSDFVDDSIVANASNDNEENAHSQKKSNRSNPSVDDYLKSGKFSEKTIQDIAMISKKISFDFDESEISNDDLESNEKDLSDIDEIIKKHSRENDEPIKTEDNTNKNLINNSLDDSQTDDNTTLLVSQDSLNVSKEDQNQPVRRRTWYFKSTIYLFLFVFCFTFVSFTYVFNFVLIPVQVVGISMQPTLNLSVSDGGYYTGNTDEDHCDVVYVNKDKRYQNNDIIIVNNNGYVPSSSNNALSANNLLVSNSFLNKLKTANADEQNNQNETTSLIKRVVATEFQTIVFTRINYNVVEPLIKYSVRVFDFNGNYIELDKSYQENGEMQISKYSIDYYKDLFPFYYEIFNALDTDGTYSYTVPKDQYFVMGDNRNNSIDSRYFGAVKYSDIEGEVKLIVPYKTSILQAIFIKLKSYI